MICSVCGGRGRVFKLRGPEPCPRCGSGSTRLQSAYIRLMHVNPDMPLSNRGVQNIVKAAAREGVPVERIASILDVPLMEVTEIVSMEN